MNITISDEKAVEIAQAIGVDPRAKREIVLDFFEIEKIATLSELEPSSQVIVKFEETGKTVATLLSKNLTVDVTNYKNQL